MSQSATPLTLRAPLTDAIIKHRNTLWAILVVLYALAYTGQWKIGRDSALYRGLAHALASGQGYNFGEFGSRQIYPGLPVLLAGLEKIFGSAAWPGIIIIHLMSIACLVLTYKLVRLHFPQWLAIIVTFCVGLNGRYLELTNELLADIPFLLGMMLALYGWERLRLQWPSDPRQIRRPLVYLFVGLALAAVMRPTFWILALAFGLVCLWGLITARGQSRRFYGVCLGLLLLVWLIMAATDPRVRGFKPFAGGYESDAFRALTNATVNVRRNLPEFTGSAMNYAFFGQKWWPDGFWWRGVYVPALSDLMSVVVTGAALLLWRVNPLWTLIVLLTVAVTLVMTVVSRYYIMVLPLTMLGWFMLTIVIAQRVPRRWLEVALLAGILLVALPGFANCLKVISQQHGWNRKAGEPDKYQYVIDMAEEIRNFVPPGERVIAPMAQIMSYFSGRHCVMQREIIPAKKSPIHWPRHIEALGIRYAVFPSLLYTDDQRIVRELIDRGVIVPVERVAKRGETALFRIEIKVPPPGKDWRKQPIVEQGVRAHTSAAGTTRPSREVLAARKRKIAAEKRARAEAKVRAEARLERQQRLERQAAAERAAAKIRKARAERRRAATQATQPATAPATQPAAKRGICPLPANIMHERRRPLCHSEVLRGISAFAGVRDPSEYLGMTMPQVRVWR